VRKFKRWIGAKLDVRAVKLAFGHDLREFALLWLVFSLLDPLIAGSSSRSWMVTNGLLCIALWIAGSYIELRRTTKDEG
jgi:hypothetical protein